MTVRWYYGSRRNSPVRVCIVTGTARLTSTALRAQSMRAGGFGLSKVMERGLQILQPVYGYNHREASHRLDLEDGGECSAQIWIRKSGCWSQSPASTDTIAAPR